MNITEIEAGRKALASLRPNVYEYVYIKHITREGTVVIHDSYGVIRDAAPYQIIKLFQA